MFPMLDKAVLVHERPEFHFVLKDKACFEANVRPTVSYEVLRNLEIFSFAVRLHLPRDANPLAVDPGLHRARRKESLARQQTCSHGR